MRAQLARVRVPKEGSTDREYEDASWPHRIVEEAVPRLQAAVADGATESVLAGLWAQLLVRCCTRATPADIHIAVERAVAAWPAAVGRYRDARARRGTPIRWYEQAKLERGAWATVLSLELTSEADAAGGQFSCAAVGDACLFHLRDGRLLTAFPLTAAADFGNRPALVSSLGAAPEVELMQGAWMTGDRFVLATDAVAQWFLAQCEQNSPPVDHLTEVAREGRTAQRAWASGLRRTGEMRDDDVTALVLEPASSR